MRPVRNAPKLSVSNKLLNGVNGKYSLPTFVLDLRSMTPERLEFEMHWVSALQSVAPVFRVVLMSDRDVFGSARRAGWPVEHVLSRENADRLLLDGSTAYMRERIRTIESQYARPATVVRPRPLGSLAKAIGSLIGHAGVEELISTWPDWEKSNAASWPDVVRSLQAGVTATFESEEGIVDLTTTSKPRGAVLVVGNGADQIPLHDAAIGADVQRIDARFDSTSSFKFETMVYNSLALAFGSELSVILPWRKAAVENTQADRILDLSVEPRGGGLVVTPYYVPHYSVLAESDELDWDAAKLYAATRRLASALSQDRLDIQ